MYGIESINGTIDFSLIMNNERDRLIIKMFGQTIHAPEVPLPEEDADWEEIDITETALKSYEGIYKLNADTMFFITADDDELKVQLTGRPEIQVYPCAENKCFYKAVDASIEFVKNKNGEAEYLCYIKTELFFRQTGNSRLVSNSRTGMRHGC